MNKLTLPLSAGIAACSLAFTGCGGGGSGSGTSAPTDPPAQARSYTITDIAPLPGNSTSDSSAVGINASGQVVGRSSSPTKIHAFLFQGGQVQDLGILPGGGSSGAEAINGAGQVVGEASSTGDTSTGAAGLDHACLFQNGQAQDLGTLPISDPTRASSYAYGVNNSGQSVGASVVSSGRYHACLFQGGQVQDMGTLPGGADGGSIARGINGAGQVVGESAFDASDYAHAFLWQNGQMHDLGVLPGGTESYANAINTAGQVAGSATVADGSRYACLFQGGQVQDLGTLPGEIDSIAYAINTAGQVVGESDAGSGASPGIGGAGGSDKKVATLPVGTMSAFLWQNGKMQDLNTLIPANSGWVLQQAMGINDRGQICGYGMVNNQFHAFLLTPAVIAQAGG